MYAHSVKPQITRQEIIDDKNDIVWGEFVAFDDAKENVVLYICVWNDIYIDIVYGKIMTLKEWKKLLD